MIGTATESTDTRTTLVEITADTTITTELRIGTTTIVVILIVTVIITTVASMITTGGTAKEGTVMVDAETMETMVITIRDRDRILGIEVKEGEMKQRVVEVGTTAIR